MFVNRFYNFIIIEFGLKRAIKLLRGVKPQPAPQHFCDEVLYCFFAEF